MALFPKISEIKSQVEGYVQPMMQELQAMRQLLTEIRDLLANRKDGA